MKIKRTSAALLLTCVFNVQSAQAAQVTCRQAAIINIGASAHLAPSAQWIDNLALPLERRQELHALVENDPELARVLSDKDYQDFALAVTREKPDLKEMADIINRIWTRGEENVNLKEALPGDVRQILREVERFPINREKFRINLKSTLAQLKQFPITLKKIKTLITAELHPVVLDARVFDFFGFLNLKLDYSRLRPWETIEGGIKGTRLSDVVGMNPSTWARVSMMASEIEAPIDAYSDNSGEVLRAISPQASRFMGKTDEEAAIHRKKKVPYCEGSSWCLEENRHSGTLENIPQPIMGYKLPQTVEFGAYPNLNPLRVEDAFFHLVSRNSTEWNAGSAYFFLGAHAEGNLGKYIKQVRNDEEKHMAIFGGLYKYLKGDTYGARLKGMLQKAWMEIKEKNSSSDYGTVFNTEPVSAIEMAVIHVLYEIEIRKFFSSLPLKSLRKIYETEINLKPFPAEDMDPKKSLALQQLSKIEETHRKSLARWPKEQREAAQAQESFEIRYNDLISSYILDRFDGFKGAEVYGSKKHSDLVREINNLSAADPAFVHNVRLSKQELNILKASLRDSLRDYQIFNNQTVREKGLSVAYKNALTGFMIVKDAAFESLPKVTERH